MLPLKLQTLQKKNSGHCCLNTFGTTLHSSKPYAMLSERLQTTYHRKNPVQCCLNIPGTILHRKNPQYCLRGFRLHCTGKNSVQCLLNTIWSLSGNFYFGPVNFIIISGCCKCHANILES